MVDVMSYMGFDDVVLGHGRFELDGTAAVVEEKNIELGGVEVGEEDLKKGIGCQSVPSG